MVSHCAEGRLSGAVSRDFLRSRLGGDVLLLLNDGRCSVEENALQYLQAGETLHLPLQLLPLPLLLPLHLLHLPLHLLSRLCISCSSLCTSSSTCQSHVSLSR